LLTSESFQVPKRGRTAPLYNLKRDVKAEFGSVQSERLLLFQYLSSKGIMKECCAGTVLVFEEEEEVDASK
jgi:hypothetical protein